MRPFLQTPGGVRRLVKHGGKQFSFAGELWTVRASLVAQSVKNLPAEQETQVQSLGQENPLEKRMAIHSRILAWKIPWTKESGGLQSMGSQSQAQLSD